MRKKGWSKKRDLPKALGVGSPPRIRIRPIQKMKERFIDFLFSKGGIWLTRMLTGAGTSLAGWFEMNDQDTQGMTAALAALIGFILIGVRGKVKEKFVKDYQALNHLEVDGAPLKITNAHLRTHNHD